MSALIATEYVTLDADPRNREIAEAWARGGAVIIATTVVHNGGEKAQ